MKKKSLPILTICLFISNAQAEWEFEASPYLYLLNTNANINSDIYSGTLTRSFGQILKNLDNAYFFSFSAKNNHWISSFSITHAKLTHNGIIDSIPFSAMAKYTSLYGATGYQFNITPDLNIDLMAGVRHWAFKSSLSVGDKNESPSKYWVEPLIIAKTKYQLTPKVSMELNTEISIHSNNHSRQLGTNISYGISKNWSATIGYKWEYLKPDIDGIDLKIKTNGAVLGGTYRF
ncbi:hypothetical protein ACY19I_19815 [Morganella morganii]|uniref:hypothetical protein n=1 Tax=Morganella morganii TaxID=582 RepID=UPI0021A90DB4|nr:hypothetical protein [Morganella morganii]EJK8625231.1 hypothetical protein [Morganella morganii]EKW5730496.1 hypothetical protein [Morganella morganii]